MRGQAFAHSPRGGARASRRRGPNALGAALLAACLALAGCADTGGNTVAEQAREVADRDYITGDGRIEQLASDQRGEPVELVGTTLEGEPWSSADHRGEALVVNVWGSWCPPCVAEMPELESAWQQAQEKGTHARFVGVNLNESPATAAAFMRTEGVTYPSLADDGGASLIALQERASTPPTTLVLDRQGRIAARVAGQTTASTVLSLVDDVLAQG